MENGSYQVYKDKIVIRIRTRICESVDELIKSKMFMDILSNYVKSLFHQQSRLLRVFQNEEKVTNRELKTMRDTLLLLSKIPADQARLLIPASETFFEDITLLMILLNNFITIGVDCTGL